MKQYLKTWNGEVCCSSSASDFFRMLFDNQENLENLELGNKQKIPAKLKIFLFIEYSGLMGSSRIAKRLWLSHISTAQKRIK